MAKSLRTTNFVTKCLLVAALLSNAFAQTLVCTGTTTNTTVTTSPTTSAIMAASGGGARVGVIYKHSGVADLRFKSSVDGGVSFGAEQTVETSGSVDVELVYQGGASYMAIYTNTDRTYTATIAVPGPSGVTNQDQTVTGGLFSKTSTDDGATWSALKVAKGVSAIPTGKLKINAVGGGAAVVWTAGQSIFAQWVDAAGTWSIFGGCVKTLYTNYVNDTSTVPAGVTTSYVVTPLDSSCSGFAITPDPVIVAAKSENDHGSNPNNWPDCRNDYSAPKPCGVESSADFAIANDGSSFMVILKPNAEALYSGWQVYKSSSSANAFALVPQVGATARFPLDYTGDLSLASNGANSYVLIGLAENGGFTSLYAQRTQTGGITWSTPLLIEFNAGSQADLALFFTGSEFLAMWNDQTHVFISGGKDGVLWYTGQQALFTGQVLGYSLVTPGGSAYGVALFQDNSGTSTIAYNTCSGKVAYNPGTAARAALAMPVAAALAALVVVA